MKNSGLYILSMLFGLTVSGCATSFSVVPEPSEGQITLHASGQESLISIKKHKVTVGTLQSRLQQFDEIRVQVKVLNQGKDPITFSAEQVSGSLDGQAISSLSFDSQLQDINNRLSYYGRSPFGNTGITIGIGRGYGGIGGGVGGGFGVTHGTGFGVYNDFDANMNSIDVQNALRDLDRLQKYGLRPGVIKPGQEYGGEVVFSKRPGAGKIQELKVMVEVDGQTYPFTFNLNAYRH